MGVFPGFGAWINQNNQQPLNGESNRSENVESKSVSEKDTNKAPTKAKKVYYDKDEENKQYELWRNSDKKHPWHDAPPKVKVTTENGLCHMHIELIVGMTPNVVYDLLADPDNGQYFDMGKNGRQLLKYKSSKVLKEDGPRKIVKVEKAVAWDFLWLTGTIPINLIIDGNKKDLTAKYKKEKMMFMKVFEGNWKVEPFYVDQERLCKNMLPKSREEYKKCSGGLGKVGSKVILDQYFQPYPLLDLPPVSWYIRDITIKTTTVLLRMLQNTTAILREM